MSKNDGGAAFPHRWKNVNDVEFVEFGMSVRDYFAGQALAGQIVFEGMEGCDAALIAGCAYELADAMIAERHKGEPK